jgi:hypothetical protein
LFALTKPAAQLVIDGRPPSGLQDGSGRFIDGGRAGTAASDGVAILSRGRASVEPIAAGAASGQDVGTMAVVHALFEQGSKARPAYYAGKKAGRAFQPDSPDMSGWKARPT